MILEMSCNSSWTTNNASRVDSWDPRSSSDYEKHRSTVSLFSDSLNIRRNGRVQSTWRSLFKRSNRRSVKPIKRSRDPVFGVWQCFLRRERRYHTANQPYGVDTWDVGDLRTPHSWAQPSRTQFHPFWNARHSLKETFWDFKSLTVWQAAERLVLPDLSAQGDWLPVFKASAIVQDRKCCSEALGLCNTCQSVAKLLNGFISVIVFGKKHLQWLHFCLHLQIQKD